VHKVENSPDDESYEAMETAAYSGREIEGKTEVAKESLYTNWPLISSIIVYCVFSLHDIAYTEVKFCVSFMVIYLSFS